MKHLKRGISLLLVVVLLAFPLTGCSSQQPGSGAKDAWTIFVYLCGTDLESGGGAATENLNEMLAVPADEDINIIVQTGGTADWQTDGIDSTKLQRFELSDGTMELVGEQPLASMGSSLTLYNFLSWGFETYDSQNYGFVFWDHGGGSILGAESDELFAYDSLTLFEMKEAFSLATAASDERLEFVGFDACLMATLETAMTFEPYAQYLVASEETEPGGGWNYTPIIQALNDNPEIKGEELGTIICDEYYAKCVSEGTQEMTTLSLLDLSKMTAVSDAFDDIAVELSDSLDNIEIFGDISREIHNAERYGDSWGDDPNRSRNMVDMGDLAVHIDDYLATDTSILYDALEDAVVHRVQGPGRGHATGLSFYYPISIGTVPANYYLPISPSDSYSEYIRSLAAEKSAYEADDEDIIQILEDAHITDENHFEMTLSPDCLDYIQSISFELYTEEISEDEDGVHASYSLYLGNDNDLFFDEATGLIRDNFDDTWPTLDGVPVMLEIVDDTDEYTLYSIPINLNGSFTYLRAAWIWDEGSESFGHFELYDTWTGVDEESGLPAKDAVDLKDGDIIEPLYRFRGQAYDEESGQTRHHEEWSPSGVEITYSSDQTLEFDHLDEGDYQYRFKIIDIFGGVYESDFATVAVIPE